MNENLRLGLYDEIDSIFKHWNQYNNVLKIQLIEGDAESYGNAIYGREVECIGRVTVEMLIKIEQEFASISKIGPDKLKEIYAEFIAGIAKPKKKSNKKPQGEYTDEHDQAYTLRDEYKAVIAIQQGDEAANTEYEEYEKQVEKLEELTINASLSAVEEVALAFIKDKNITKSPLLNIFTMSGIIQIANRAAYKLYSMRG